MTKILNEWTLGKFVTFIYYPFLLSFSRSLVWWEGAFYNFFIFSFLFVDFTNLFSFFFFKVFSSVIRCILKYFYFYFFCLFRLLTFTNIFFHLFFLGLRSDHTDYRRFVINCFLFFLLSFITFVDFLLMSFLFF